MKKPCYYGGSIKSDGKKEFKSGTCNVPNHRRRDLQGTSHQKRLEKLMDKAKSLD